MTAPPWKKEDKQNDLQKLKLNFDTILSKRPKIKATGINLKPKVTSKQGEEIALPPIPPASPVEKPSSNWTPEEVNAVNKIEDKIERGRNIGNKNAKLILGKLPTLQETTGNQPGNYNPVMDETMQQIKCSIAELKYPSKG